jgi:hypothetical protein
MKEKYYIAIDEASGKDKCIETYFKVEENGQITLVGMKEIPNQDTESHN